MLLTHRYTVLALDLGRNVEALSVVDVSVFALISMHEHAPSQGSGIPVALLSSLLSFRIPLHKSGLSRTQGSCKDLSSRLFAPFLLLPDLHFLLFSPVATMQCIQRVFANYKDCLLSPGLSQWSLRAIMFPSSAQVRLRWKAVTFSLFFFQVNFTINYVYVTVCMCVSAPAFGCPQRPEEGIKPPGAEVGLWGTITQSNGCVFAGAKQDEEGG